MAPTELTSWPPPLFPTAPSNPWEGLSGRPPYAGELPLSAWSGDQVTGSEFSAETAPKAPVLVRLQSVG